MAINEQDAFQVFGALQAGQVPDEMKPRALSLLSAYRSESVKKMQDVFGNLQTLDAEDGSFITADRFAPGAGDKLRKKEANVLWLANRYNLPTSAIRSKYDLYKADASSQWGDAMLDDESFFSKAGGEVAKQKKKAELIQSAQEAAFRSAVTMGDDVADFGQWQFANPDPEAFTDEVQSAWDEEKRRTMDRLGADGLGLADRVVRTLRHEQGVANEPDAWLNQTVEMLTQLKATDPEKYDLVMAVAKAKGEKSDKPDKELAAGAAEQFARTSADIISGVPRFLTKVAAEGSAQLAEAGLTTAENPELLAARSRGRQAIISDLKDLGEGVIDPIESQRKGWAKHAENTVFMAAGAIPTMAAAMIPGGQTALTGMFANESYEDFRRAGWSGADALAASVGAGMFQSSIERASEVAAKVPWVAQWMAKYGVQPGMSFVKNWLARTAVRGGTETAEEAIQQATAPAAQELLSMAFSNIPDRPEGQKLKDVLGELAKSENSIPLLLTGLTLGAIGAGVSTTNDITLAAAVTRDPRLLRAVMSEADARKIEQEQDQAVRSEMIRKAWIATPTDQIVSKIRDIVTQDKKAVEESKSVLAEAEKALMITKIRRDAEGWKVERNGQMVRVASREAAVKIAYSSLDDYERTMYESMATVADDLLGKKEAMEISARTQTLEDEVREGRLSPIAAAKRAELSAQMSGMTPEQAQKARWVVLGKNTIEIVNNVRTAVSRVFGGGNVITAMHEHAHGRWTLALRDGYVSHDEGLSWVRMAENATGIEFLPTKDDAQVTPQMLEEAIVEVVSADNIGRRKEDTRFTPGAISRGIASALLLRKRQRFGERQKGKMTEERLKDFKAFMASYREFWGVVLRNARALMKSRKEGKLGEDYQAFLDKMMNVDESSQQETQAAQEAVDIVEGKAAFSLAPRSLVSVADDIIATKMAKPEYKERFYTEARERLAKIRAKQGDIIPNEATKRDRQMAALRTLDAILAAFPPEIRGKVGGFVRMADMRTDKARQKELDHRLNILERYVENDAKKYYGEKMDKLLDKARPKKEAGKKPKGKLGADVHDLFATIEEAMGWTAEKADAHAEGLETVIAGGTLTPEQEAHDTLEAQAVRLVAAWKDAPSAQREAAVSELTNVYETAYIEAKKRIIAKREKRERERGYLIVATGKQGSATERDAQTEKDLGKTFLYKSRAGFLTFKQAMRWAFGDSEIAASLAERERIASNTSEDAIQDKMNDLDNLFKGMAGSSYDGEKLRWRMSQKSIEIDGRKLSELEALAATMMWMQEDGRRHMIGNLDENGKPVSKWHYNQKFVDAIEAKLSPEAKAVRSYLLDQYSQEWPSLNAVYSKLNGINLPNIPLYSPVTVTPMQVKQGQMVDPVTGAVTTGASTTPGALKSRSGKIAEPEFRDVLKTYIAHTKQIEHWKAYAELVEDTRALLGNRDVLNAIEAASGKSGSGVLGGWVDFFAEGGTREAAAFLDFSQGIDAMTSRAASMALVGRLGTIFVQASQLAAAAAKMPLGSYMIRLGKLFAGQLDYSAAFKSAFIQRRIQQQPALVQEAMKGLLSKKPSRVKQAQRELGKLISGADGLFTAGTFAIVYDYQLKQAKELGLSAQEAESYAMQTTEQTVDELAQPTRAGARSLLENRLRGWGARLVWSFASESRKNLGLMLVESQKGMTNKRFARAALYTIALNSVASWVIRSAWRDLLDKEDDETFDEKNWNLARLAITAATDWTKGVPILGDAIQAAAFRAAGEYQPEGNLLSGAGRGVQAGLKLAQRLDEEGVADGLLSQETINDADLILSAAGLTNDNIAAAASVAHLLKDLSKLVGDE